MSWLILRGEQAVELERVSTLEVEKRITGRAYRASDVAYLQQHTLPLLGKTLQVAPSTLEKLRYLAQTWDVRLRPPEITSHRKYVGRFIVLAKRGIFRVLEVLLRQQLQQQRDFNSKVLELLVDMNATTNNLNSK